MTHQEDSPLVRALVRIFFVFGLALGTTVFVACDDDDGPLEEAGESVDEAVEDVTD